jgi:hypothetical protein
MARKLSELMGEGQEPKPIRKLSQVSEEPIAAPRKRLSELEPTRLEKAVDVSEKVLGTLGKGIEIATTPFRAIEKLSKTGSEALTEKLGEAQIPAPLAATAGLVAGVPEIAVKAVKVPFKAFELISEQAGKAGSKVAEFLAEKGVSPTKSAILGTTVALLPDIALSFAPLKAAPKGKLAAPGKRLAVDIAKEEARLVSPQAKIVAITTERGTPLSQDLINVVKEGKDITQAQKAFGNLNFLADKVDRATAGPFRSHVLDPIEQGVVRQATESAQAIDAATELLSKLKIKPAESKDLLAFIEKRSAAPPGKEAAYAQMRDFYRKQYDDLLREQNAVNTDLSRNMTPAQREAAGLNPIVKRDDFVHHMRDMNIADDLGAAADQVNSATGFIKRRVPGRGFDKPRFDAIPEEMLSGAIEAFESYVFKAKRFKHNARNADRLRELAKQAREANKPKLSANLDNLADRVTGEAVAKSVKGAGIGTGGALTPEIMRVIGKAGGRFADNVILGNIGAGVAQVGAQMIGSIYTGAGRALSAIPGGLGTNLWDKIMKAAVNPSYRSFARTNSKTVQLYERAVAKSAITAAGPVKQAFVNFFNYINDSMVIGTFNQGYKAARQSGFSHAQAVKTADQVARRAQAVYVDIFRPAVISKSSALGRIILPFQTYVFNTLDVLKNDIRFAPLTAAQKAAAVGQMAATGVMLNLGLKAITGRTKIDVRDVIPAFRVAEMGLSGPFLAAALPVQAAGQLLQGRVGKAGSKIAQATALFGLPTGGLQALKTAKGAKAILGGQTDKPVRSLIFGPIRKQGRKRRKRRKR